VSNIAGIFNHRPELAQGTTADPPIMPAVAVEALLSQLPGSITVT